MLTVSEAAALLRSFDRVLILTHIRPDGDTVGCAAGLCAALRAIGKTAYLLPNPGLTENTAPYFTPYSAPADFVPEKVVSTDIATVGLFPDNAKSYADKVDLAIDHHPSFEGFGKANIVRPEAAACGELISDIVRELTPLTPEMALPLYVAISTDTGVNLLEPGETPYENAQFLLFLAAFVKGVDEYQDFLRATVAFPGNDHRLGASEAPPAVLSIFLGDELDAIVQSIIRGTEFKEAGKRTLQIGVDAMPPIPQDNTDRNRTSPMAFTGNKFEFRMLGSSQSISGPNIALNTIMAEELQQFADQLEKSKNFQSDLEKLIKKVFTDHQRIIFNGNGYDDAWIAEAEKRGLSNLKSAADALPVYTAKKNVDLFVKHGIYTKEEINARAEIHIENYTTVLTIEARTMADMLRRQILPAVSKYAAELCERSCKKEQMGVSHKADDAVAREMGQLTDKLYAATEKMERDLSKIPADAKKAMAYSHDHLIPDMEKARELADRLEELTPAERWPFPVYSDLLFSV